jgi:hypothetical protein
LKRARRTPRTSSRSAAGQTRGSFGVPTLRASNARPPSLAPRWRARPLSLESGETRAISERGIGRTVGGPPRRWRPESLKDDARNHRQHAPVFAPPLTSPSRHRLERIAATRHRLRHSTPSSTATDSTRPTRRASPLPSSLTLPPQRHRHLPTTDRADPRTSSHGSATATIHPQSKAPGPPSASPVVHRGTRGCARPHSGRMPMLDFRRRTGGPCDGSTPSQVPRWFEKTRLGGRGQTRPAAPSIDP